MRRYDEQILGALLDRYERSLLYDGRNQVNITIDWKIRKSTLPAYFDESSLQYDVIHEQLAVLEDRGFVRLVWKNDRQGHILDRCVLVVERVDEIYRLLNRTPRREKEAELLKICDYWEEQTEGETDTEVLRCFLTWLRGRMESGGAVARYVDPDQPDHLDRLCHLVYEILKNRGDTYLRPFSIRVFHDSKMAEKEIRRAAELIREFSGREDLKELETDQILEEYGVFRNPVVLMVKGCGRFTLRGYSVDLSAFSGGIGVTPSDLPHMIWEEVPAPRRVLTIENLTSFHQWKTDEKTLVIYLGGFPGLRRSSFLRRIYEVLPQAEYWHFGDLDCGGFRIWKSLCAQSGVPFRTLRMDRETYEKYLAYGRPLTESDRKMLAGMKQDPFFQDQWALFDRMLEAGIKLEQEIIPGDPEFSGEIDGGEM